MSAEIKLVPIQKNQVDELLVYIYKMAEYEKLVSEVSATVENLRYSLFEQNAAEVYFLQKDGNNIGFVLFTVMFSTFTGKPTLYLEDIFIDENERGNGYGKWVFLELARIASSRNYGRIDWVCLDWNEPSIKFYRGLGAKSLDDWMTFRLDEDGFKQLLTK